MKKGITLIAAIAAVLAVTSGAFAAGNYVISASSQIRDGAISILDLSPNARKALKGQKGATGAKGAKGDTGFSPTAFGPYASDSPDSGICGNTWANDTMDRSYVVYPQLDGSFLVAETFTNGTFTTIAGNSPQDSDCGSTENDVAAGITGTMHGDFLVKVPAGLGKFNPEAECAAKCYTKDFVQAIFGTDSYEVPVFEFHFLVAGPW